MGVDQIFCWVIKTSPKFLGKYLKKCDDLDLTSWKKVEHAHSHTLTPPTIVLDLNVI